MGCSTVYILVLFFGNAVFSHFSRDFINGSIDKTGTIENRNHNYLANTHAEWLIEAPKGYSITLQFSQLITECSFDYLFVYDGRSQSSDTKILATISGSSSPSVLYANSGSMLIVFFTDQNSNRFGFQATYKVSQCPNDCRKDLNERHICKRNGDDSNFYCDCIGGIYEGIDCSIPACPENCGYHERRGMCNENKETETQVDSSSASNSSNAENFLWKCKCETKKGYFIGESCILELDREKNYQTWTRLYSNGREGPTPVTGADAVVIKNHSDPLGGKLLYTFGGFDLTEVVDAFHVYDIYNTKWNIEKPKSTPVPKGRAFHTLTNFGDSKIAMIGGVLKLQYKSQDERMERWVWVYDTKSRNWIHYNWPFKQGIADHTSTLVGHEIFVIGGRLANDSYNHFIYVLDTVKMTWSARTPEGYHGLLLRRVGHTTVYDKKRKVLLVFGGYAPFSPSFSKKTNDLLAYSTDMNYLTMWETVERDRGAKPDELAHHSAVIMGNYMVVFGGSMKGDSAEKSCVMNETFLFHLDCHMWIDKERVLIGNGGLSTTMHAAPPRKGHVAVLLDDNLMGIYGGYDGTVRSDLYVYKAPPSVFDEQEDAVCQEASQNEELCHQDPKCSYCHEWTGGNKACLSRSDPSGCRSVPTNGMCPGVCGSQADCTSCLLFGNENCFWCSAQQRCMNKTDQTEMEPHCPNTGPDNTGVTNILDSCKYDFPRGFIEKIFFQPVNWDYPDYVKVGLGSDIPLFFDIEMDPRYVVSMRGPDQHAPIVAQFRGTLELMGAADGQAQVYAMLLENLNTSVNISEKKIPVTKNAPVWYDADSLTHKEWLFLNDTKCESSDGCDIQIEANMTVSNRQANGRLKIFKTNHNGSKISDLSIHQIKPTRWSKQCSRILSCLECTGEGVGVCGWDERERKCIGKWETPQEKSLKPGLVVYPHHCITCTDHVECTSCNAQEGCVWARTSTSVQCLRRPPEQDLDEEKKLSEAQRKFRPAACPKPCHLRATCGECFKIGSETGSRFSECAWCESLQKCMPFYMYLPAYSYGICKSYSEKNTPAKCTKCSEKDTCASCLNHPGCGFCEDNGVNGKSSCVGGNFNGPFETCAADLFSTTMSSSLSKYKPRPKSSSVRLDHNYFYHKCPNRDECLDANICNLEVNGSHCVNTEDGYECRCKNGYIKKEFTDDHGHTKMACKQTCEKPCGPNGNCIKNDTTDEHTCICDKGYFGNQCQFDCGCNKRSHCKSKGKCLKCDEGYTGKDCSLCMDGFYRNSSSECTDCECNGNGNPKEGICKKDTGKCVCMNNTEGDHCERCKLDGFYSRSPDDKRCYRVCDSMAQLPLLKDQQLTQYIGSEQGPSAENPEQVACIWLINYGEGANKSPAISSGTRLTFEIVELNVDCSQNFVYVYENTPSFLSGDGGTGDSSMNSDSNQRDKLLGAFCGKSSPLSGHTRVIESETTITVIFKANVTDGNQFFTAKITKHDKPCVGNWINRGGDDACECPSNMTGWNCDLPSCPNNCSIERKQGACVVGDDDKYFCSCKKDFTGRDCSQKITHQSKPQFTILLPGAFGREAKYGRHGHTIVVDKSQKYLYIIGGRNFANSPVDMIKYSIDENKLTTVRTEFLIIPYRGYYHTSAITDSDTVYVFGGLQQMDHKGSRTFWHFIPDAKAQNDKLKMSPVSKDDYPAYSEPGHSWIPTVAQHTMNYVKIHNQSNPSKKVELLVIIGGYSPEHGFNNYTLQYDIEKKAWSAVPTAGSTPIGIFGHTTVYYEPFKTFYVYGGFVYWRNSVVMSNELYALTYSEFNDGSDSSKEPAKWSVVYPKDNLFYRLPAIVFHQAVIVSDYMVVLGGRTDQKDFTNEVMIYVIKCNTWLLERHSFSNSVFGKLRFEPVIGHSAVAIGSDIYIYGGFNGVTFQSMHKLSMPDDICNLQHGTNKADCERLPGCTYCEAIKPSPDECGGFGSCCLNSTTYTRKGSLICVSRSRYGANNDECWVDADARNYFPSLPRKFRASCSQHRTCEQCVSDFLEDQGHISSREQCQWCDTQNSCKRKGEACDAKNPSADHNVIYEPRSCSKWNMCLASDCGKCTVSSACFWSRMFQNQIQSSVIKMDPHSNFDWGCYPLIIQKLAVNIEQTCPAPCHSYENCSSCLNSGGADGGRKECYWAQGLNECISPTFAAIQCAAGECGRVVRHSTEGCPKLCEDQRKCSSCKKMTHCGWCSLQSGRQEYGMGACWEGGINGPRQQRCTSDSVISHLLSRPAEEQTLDHYELFALRGHAWSHTDCPPENECKNHHHDCDSKTERCEDKEEGFECVCKDDYLINDKTGKCEPQCKPPCSKNGKCVEPNECKCDLGYKGAQCETSCACHGHSVCSNDLYKPCLNCQHNTGGTNCEKCVRKYYGNATSPSSNACKKCSSLCNGKSDYCINRAMYEKKFSHLTNNEDLMSTFDDLIMHGPEANESNTSNLICIMCQNHTAGDLCEKCKPGYYKHPGTNECVPCQCNGHAIGNLCDPETGLDCDCQGNTQTPAECKSNSIEERLRSTCAASLQCSICEKPMVEIAFKYKGEPANGRQCYRELKCWTNTFMLTTTHIIYDNVVDQTIGLKVGEATFFFVDPEVKTGRQMHRVVLEISQGSVDLYVSDDYRMVKKDQSNELSPIMLYDANGYLIPPRKRRPRTTPSPGQVTATRIPPASSSSEIVHYAKRQRRLANNKPEFTAQLVEGTNDTVELNNNQKLLESLTKRQSMYVMNAQFNAEKKAMYVNLRPNKTILIAENITGRFEVLLPVNENNRNSVTGVKKKQYYFGIHNPAEVNGVKRTDLASGIIYQVQSETRLPIPAVISFIIYFFACAASMILLFIKCYTVLIGDDNQNLAQNSEKESSCPTVQIDFHFKSQIDPLPDQFDSKKADLKTRYLSLPSKNTQKKNNLRNIQMLGRQLYCAKTLCYQPFRDKNKAPMTVMFETPSSSGGQKFFFGTAIVQCKSKKNPEIIPTTPQSNGALNHPSIVFQTQRSDSSFMGSESQVNANANCSTLPNRNLHRSSGSISNNFYLEKPNSNFGSLSRGVDPRMNRFQIYGGHNMVPRSGSMATTVPMDASATSTINRSSLQRNSMTRSQTFSQRQTNLSPTTTSII
ncbi:multiple epidermal growth factor-like domains protein 8 isoform X4 [Symsagittifera roscoffensis]|uniref:multiple epidermal growth factor-like domains protein 8 isoform X4 n=1 Tax=Symsagittifera roscoffensis TaxID=84072 RepID=UPI00307C8161